MTIECLKLGKLWGKNYDDVRFWDCRNYYSGGPPQMILRAGEYKTPTWRLVVMFTNTITITNGGRDGKENS